jgi:hypothetical protein
MMLRFLALASLPLLAAACAPADPAVQAARSEAAIAAAPAARVLGTGQNCIDRSQVRNSVVRSDQVIDFEMVSGKVFRSTLRDRCPGLGWDRAISYDTSINQLCTTQIIYSLQNIGGVPQRGAGCTLGEFVPVEYVKKAKRR